MLGDSLEENLKPSGQAQQQTTLVSFFFHSFTIKWFEAIWDAVGKLSWKQIAPWNCNKYEEFWLSIKKITFFFTGLP